MNEFRIVGSTSVRQRDLVARPSLWGMVAGLLGIGFLRLTVHCQQFNGLATLF
jgi:hypothetical protein